MRSVASNAGTYDRDVSVPPLQLSILGSSSVSGFVSLLGSDQSVLPVRLNVSGPFGLPCDGQLVQALLNGTQLLGVNRSDSSSGVVLMRLNIRQPPGRYSIMFALLPGEDQSPRATLPPANLTLQVRSCIVGEVTPAPDACQACPEGSFSLEPHSSSCRDCPAGAQCPGGFAIVPLPGMWHSAPESPQLHSSPNMAACDGNRSALLGCTASQGCRNAATGSSSSSIYTDLQCSPGYQGNLCGACTQGYSLVKPFTCKRCLPGPVVAVLYVLSACALLAFMLVFCRSVINDSSSSSSSSRPAIAQLPDQGSHSTGSDRAERQLIWLQVSSLLRPLVLYMQYALILASVTGVELPAPLAYPLQALAWAWAPAVPQSPSIECILSHGSSSSSIPVSIQCMLFYLSMPFVVLVLLPALDSVCVLLYRKRPALSTAAVGWRERLAVAVTVVFIFFAPSVLWIAFGWFACIPIDAPVDAPYVAAAVGSLWLHDPGQLCYQGYHRAWALGLGLPLLVVVCGLLPAGILWAVLRNRQRHTPHATNMPCLKCLVWPYKPSYCWWDASVLLQTAALTAVGVF
uniref:Tyrosine-protein kinase ephrin type A/B receptor-like domain-containing protein n=1 Tax=Tetradesmus obliquus TaxID=3088 RepID=A0A383V756_TETOB|eukprot:jgi/Sobl393_1/18644/SZX61428.1